ncbi:MAG: UDP-N-acetylmuramate dehydrogenase [Pseudomonadota bacterium]
MNAARNALPAVRGELLVNEPLSRHTSWRVGGPARQFFKPADADDLAEFLAALEPEVPLCWVGLGSNLLMRDGGFDGVVISTLGAFGDIERLDDTHVRAGASVACAQLARRCARLELGPSAFFAGIPGTVGGALAMNAGAFGGETWSRVESVDVIDRAGVRRRRQPDEYVIGYRSVQPPVAGEWFLGADFVFETGVTGGRDDIRELLAKRKATQPMGLPSCGSVFRNPPGDYAARLIESAGLKGLRIGGAEVSPKHANFIINTGDATAADIEELLVHVMDTVEQSAGIRLIPEVRIVGDAA